MKFSQIYPVLLGDLLEQSTGETNERTGAKIYSLPPYSFSISLADRQLPLPGNRKMFPRTAAAEVAWFLQGKQDGTFIKNYAPIWDKFTEDDGTTVAAAYGYRWRHHFGRDQIASAIRALISNPTDRRVYVSAWDPAEDGLGRPGKNVPCPVGFSLSLREGKLNSALFIRSSDVFVGLPYDVMGHALLMDAIGMSISRGAHDIPIQLGELHVTLAHPHLYDCHREMAEASLAEENVADEFLMPGWGTKRIVSLPDEYVKLIGDRAKLITQPEYHCRPEVVA